MSKVKVLVFLVVVLLLINGAILWMMLLNKPGRHMRDEPKRVIIERLRFDAAQIEAYQKLIDGHRANIRVSNHRMRELKNKLYATLKQPNAQQEADSIIAEIGALQITIEQIHYKHFQDIKQLCTPEQMGAFDSLSSDIAGLFGPPPPHAKN
jgi:periplasmic protein CpxP/Spy